MKEDYLWDKTGEADAEIEMLENVLSLFRYKQTAPPEIETATATAKIIPFQKSEEKRGGIFSLKYALSAAACLLVGIVMLGVWLKIFTALNVDSADNGTQTAALTDTRKTETLNTLSDEKRIISGDIAVKKFEKRESTVAVRKPMAIYKTVQKNSYRKPAKEQNAAVRTKSVQLSTEEKYAYDQLMLALSITGSKLKILKDKVDGVEEKIVPPTENGR